MKLTLTKKNRMADPSLLNFSTNLKISDSLFTAPSKEELSELLRTLPNSATNTVNACYSSKEEIYVACSSSGLEVGVSASSYTVRDPRAHRRYHHFDPDEKTLPMGTEPMNQQTCRLAVTPKPSAPMVFTRVRSFAA
jgi:hypothetical protein